jgi:hypothetical protein
MLDRGALTIFRRTARFEKEHYQLAIVFPNNAYLSASLIDGFFYTLDGTTKRLVLEPVRSSFDRLTPTVTKMRVLRLPAKCCAPADASALRGGSDTQPVCEGLEKCTLSTG